MTAIKGLTYVMFAMFAMTTDSVGLIIPEVIRTFGLSLTAAGAFQYATMGGIAVAGLFLGQLADRFGRRPVLVAGLTLFAASSFALLAGNTFLFFTLLMGLSGVAIAVFKTAALALIGDISTSTAQHTAIMNTAEGFFGIGSIIGPAILARLLGAGVAWQWLYVLAGGICVVLIVTGAADRLSTVGAHGSCAHGLERICRSDEELVRPGVLDRHLSLCGRRGGDLRLDADLARASRNAGDVAGRLQPVDFLLSARRRSLSGRLDADPVPVAGRGRTLQRRHSGVVRRQRADGGRMGGLSAAAVGAVHVGHLSDAQFQGHQLRAKAEHGAAAGVILFFTCVSAVVAPLAMGAIGDAMGHIRYAFWLAAAFSALLFVGLLLNWIFDPTRAVLERLNRSEYRQQPASL